MVFLLCGKACPEGLIAPRWWLALLGIAGIGASIPAFAGPGMTALILLWFIAAWAIAIGVLEIWGALQLRNEAEGEWLPWFERRSFDHLRRYRFCAPGCVGVGLVDRLVRNRDWRDLYLGRV
jgi:Short repeat of unknown function (DUF308)